MEQLQQQHHVEDIGRILLQTQDQLKQLREQLVAQGTRRSSIGGDSGGGGGGSIGALTNNNAGAQIEEILRNAEDELRLKAELVLNNLVSASPASPTRLQSDLVGGEFTLPSVRKPFAGGAMSPVGRRRRRVHREERDDSDDLDLDYFRQRFKSNTVGTILGHADSPSQPGVARRGGGLSAIHRNGKLVKHKTVPNARLLPFVNKYDPAEARPVLSPSDAKQGVLSLINRGFLPVTVDLTPAFQTPAQPHTTTDDERDGSAERHAGASSVIKNGAVKLYSRQEMPVRAMPYSNPSNFNLATLKFDMTSSSVANSKGKDGNNPSTNAPPGSPERSLKTVSINFPNGSGGEKSPNAKGNRGNQESGGASRYEDEAQDDEDEGGGVDGSGGTSGAGADALESDANSMEDLRRNVEKIRGYNELLDTYSLHQFIIHKGRAMRDTPEFQSFKRVGQEIWGSIEEVIKALETLLTRFFVPLAYIDGQRLMAVASMEMASFTTRELLSCIVNEDQVASLIRRPGQRYKGKDRKRRAATTLQAFFRMLRLRNRFRKVRRNGSSAMLIQKTWRAYSCQQALRKKLTQRREAQLHDWQVMMTRLRTNWRQINQQRRVVVHVPSISIDERTRLTIDNFAVKQNLQLSRLAGVMDPNVDIVYVSPFELSSEVAQYSLKLLQLGGITNAQSRVKIVFPEHAAQFPAHFSLTTHLLYSPHCLRRIQRLVKDKEAYLVMGMPGAEDQRLALTLQIPLLGLEDPRAALPLMTRSGSKRFFIKADVNVPTGTYDIYDVDELLFSLAKLIISHLDQNVWLLRLDSDPFGTGTALMDVTTLSTLREIRREKKAPEYWKQPGIRDTVARALLHELEREIATLVKPSHTEIYATWREFAAAIVQYGVVVEALPDKVVGVVRVNLFVEPSGDVHVTSTQDALTASNNATAVHKRRRPLAFAFPQSLVPYEALVGASQAVGRLLYEDHAFCGYASVDLQLFTEGVTERLWAVALHPYLTDSAATFATFHALHRGVMDPQSGHYYLPQTAAVAAPTSDSLLIHEAQQQILSSSRVGNGSPRSFVVIDYVFHPNVSTMPYSAFFHTCRLHGVCFDVGRSVGSVFLLADSLTAGVFGVLSSGETATQAMQYLRTAFEVIGRDVGTQSLLPAVGESDAVQANGNFAELLSLLRHRLGVEKDKDKAARRGVRQQQQGVATTTTVADTVGTESGQGTPVAAAAAAPEPPTPKLRVGKVDSMRRMRRGSQ